MSRGEPGAPPIPDRNYSVAKGIPTNPSVMSHRPLPKRPDEAYQRLMTNQVINGFIRFSLLPFEMHPDKTRILPQTKAQINRASAQAGQHLTDLSL